MEDLCGHEKEIMFLVDVFGDLFTPYDLAALRKTAVKEILSAPDIAVWDRCVEIANKNYLFEGVEHD